MMPIALIVLGLAALAYFRPDLFGAVLAPDTGAGGGAPFPSEKESRFDPGAINSADPHGGSWGLYQMAAATAADMGVADPRALLDPRVATAAAVRYFDWIDRYLASHGGNGLNQKIAAWNEGAAAVASGLPDWPYVSAVAANMTKWRAWLDGAAVA